MVLVETETGPHKKKGVGELKRSARLWRRVRGWREESAEASRHRNPARSPQSARSARTTGARPAPRGRVARTSERLLGRRPGHSSSRSPPARAIRDLGRPLPPGAPTHAHSSLPGRGLTLQPGSRSLTGRDSADARAENRNRPRQRAFLSHPISGLPAYGNPRGSKIIKTR